MQSLPRSSLLLQVPPPGSHLPISKNSLIARVGQWLTPARLYISLPQATHCLLVSLVLQLLAPGLQPPRPHDGHLLAGPVGLSHVPVCVPSARSPATSAPPRSQKGKDLWFWVWITPKGTKERPSGSGLGILGTPYKLFILSPQNKVYKLLGL